MELPHATPMDAVAAEEIGAVVAALEAVDADMAAHGSTRGGRETIALPWESRDELLGQMRDLESLRPIVEAFEAVGTSRPVPLTDELKGDLIAVIESGRTNSSADSRRCRPASTSCGTRSMTTSPTRRGVDRPPDPLRHLARAAAQVDVLDTARRIVAGLSDEDLARVVADRLDAQTAI